MVTSDFTMTVGTDNNLVITMVPPVPIAGWDIHWTFARRLGSTSGTADKWYASGYNTVSGISIIASGPGILLVKINAQDTSGLDPGNYANWSERLTSGAVTRISQGYMNLII